MINDRVYGNKLGHDPAYMAEMSEPRHGYARNNYLYQPPTPESSKIMNDCITFVYYWRLNFQLSADQHWNRAAAKDRINKINAQCRHMNIKLLNEYLPALKGMDKMRAYNTIANLKLQDAVDG